MTTLEVLEGARDLIRDERNWCRGKAIDDADRGCAWGAVAASAYSCSNIGRLLECYSPRIDTAWDDIQSAMDRLTRAAVRLDPAISGAIDFNDTHTHAEVMELFNIAIADELAKTKAPKVRMATYDGTLEEPVAA